MSLKCEINLDYVCDLEKLSKGPIWPFKAGPKHLPYPGGVQNKFKFILSSKILIPQYFYFKQIFQKCVNNSFLRSLL